MRKILKRWKNASILSITTILIISVVAFAHNAIPYSIDWTNTSLINTDDTWNVSAELGVRGYDGSDLTVAPGTDARTVLAESLVLDVRANQTNPNTLIEGGVAEFEIANPTIALKGSDAARAPYINLLVDSRGLSNIRVRFNVRDIDSTANNSIQQIAVQYRLDEFGDFTDIPSAYIADATQGGTATLVTPVDVTLPADANNIIFLEIRIMTVNAVGNDEWVGIDDIRVTGTPTAFSTVCDPILTITDDPSLFPGGPASFEAITSGAGTITVDSINAGTGLRVFSVVSSSNATVNIPAFTPGTFMPVVATFTVIDPNLPVNFTLRASNQFHGVLIRAQCPCVPTLSVTEDPSLIPGGLASFDAFAPEPGTVWVDHVDAGTGLQTFTVVNSTNAVVNIPAFAPGTFERIFATYTITDPSLPVDFTLRATSQYHGVLLRSRCGTPPPD